LVASAGQRGDRAQRCEEGPAEAEGTGSLELDDAGDQDLGGAGAGADPQPVTGLGVEGVSQVAADQHACWRQVITVRSATVDEMEGPERPLPGGIEAVKADAGVARSLVEVGHRSDQVEAA